MLKHGIMTLLMSIVACALLLFPHISAAAVSNSLQTCAQSIIPALFPFMVVTDLWITSGGADYVGRISDKWMRSWFRMPGEAAPALICGAVGGFPMGASTVSALHTNGKLTKEQSEHLLLFCSNAGPAFIFGVIGETVFQSKAAAMLLWMIHLIGALLIGLLFRPKQPPSSPIGSKLPIGISKGCDLVSSVTKAGSDTIRICTFIILFSIVVSFIEAFMPTMFKTPLFAPLLFGLIELAGPTAHFRYIPQHTAFILLSILLAWNGCCVHLQVRSILAKNGLSMKKYFTGKLLHMLLSLLLSLVCAPWIAGTGTQTQQASVKIQIAAIAAILLFILSAKTSYRKKRCFHI